MTTAEILKRSLAAKYAMRSVGIDEINAAIVKIADVVWASRNDILAANAEDVSASRAALGEVMTDRLMLSEERIKSMCQGSREVASLPSPIGEVIESHTAPNGLIIERVAVPLGTLAVIYESRPNVTLDAASLALKSGNCVILRSGKEAHRTSAAIVEAVRKGLSETGLPTDAVQLVEDVSRESAGELMRARGYVDMLIPRGGAGLIRACVEGATVPCLETGTGICHVYVDKSAKADMALGIVKNAKTSRPSVCNACEVCLVHKDIAKEFLPMLKRALTDERVAEGKSPVKLVLDSEAMKIIDGVPATDGSFDTEYLDYILAVGIVDSVKEAVLHIDAHSTHHSEAIISECSESIEYFTKNVDSAAVYVNASTRFTDGGEFGLGCEMGISTQKMHARGPVGIRELTTYKYVVRGNGQVR